MIGLPHRHRSAASRIVATALTAMVGFTALLVGPTPATAAPRSPVSAVPVRADATRDEQWQLKELHAREAWRQATGSGVIVAVIDSGVDGSHPDLAGQVLDGIDLVQGSGSGELDPVGHGTTVASLIAGRNDDSEGVAGLAPKAKILPVRVLDEENRYDDAMIVANGVRWAVDHGAQVINLSLGGSGDSPALAAALDYAFVRDVVVVACTGNLGPSDNTQVWYPAREPGVIAVAGLQRDTDELWAGSITGSETVLTAPANGLIGARPGGYWRVQGTSFAAPLVAATAALIRSRWPTMSAANVINRLTRTAYDLGAPGRDDQYGFGLVDPVAALTASVPSVNRNPLDNESSPGIAGFGPAPGIDRPTSPAVAAAAGQLGGRAPGGNTGWSAQPAGTPDSPSRPALFSWTALFVVVVAAAGIVVRRLTLRVDPRFRNHGR